MSGRARGEKAGGRGGEEANSAESRLPAFPPSRPEPGPVEGEAGPVVGAIGEGAATRGGEDVRRRGWFWHWNSIVTQYAPLIGLKGVGLLNSYTVWTDRREESPHRGYAFPSQQSEADFYGEDRAELITINKILVALDLIEIRKEMVLRVDERGRRWRVPHNFYRVKDHGDDFTLTSGDVLRVAELADRDKAVYRSIRRVFSPRFAPIDAANVWSRILPEVRQTDLWQRLADRAAREEDRASARTRAGHAARKSNLGMPDDGDTATIGAATNDSDRGSSLAVVTTSVASINKGFDPDVASINNGLTGESTTAVDPANAGLPTDVAPSNRTYYESTLTTTTTGLTEGETARRREGEKDDGRGELVQRGEDQGLSQGVTGHMGVGTGVDKTVVGPSLSGEGAGPGGGAAPADAAGEAVAVRAFEEANGRASSQIERRLLRELAERFDPSAREREREGSGLGTGWAWVVAAIYDAVEAGSAFVAPRRIREILGRWEREGLPDEGGKARRREGGTTGGARHAAPGGGSTRGDDSPPAIRLGDGPEIEVQLPHGFSSGRTWEFAVGLLATAIDRTHLAELVAGTAIAGYRDGEVTLAVPDAARAERIAGEYRELFTRKLSEAMRRPVRLAVLTTEGGKAGRREGGETTVGVAHASPDGGTDDAEIEALPASFVVVECGLPSGQVWAAVLDELAANGEVSRANVDAWLRLSALIGRSDEGALIVGVPHTLAQRRVAARFLPPLQAAAAAVIGVALPVEIVVTQDWLRTNPAPPVESAYAEPKRRLGA